MLVDIKKLRYAKAKKLAETYARCNSMTLHESRNDGCICKHTASLRDIGMSITSSFLHSGKTKKEAMQGLLEDIVAKRGEDALNEACILHDLDSPLKC